MTQRLVQIENIYGYTKTYVLHFNTIEECWQQLERHIPLFSNPNLKIKVSPQREGAFQRVFFTEGSIPSHYENIWVRIYFEKKNNNGK